MLPRAASNVLLLVAFPLCRADAPPSEALDSPMAGLTRFLCGFAYLVAVLQATVPMAALPAIGDTLNFRSSQGASLAAVGTFAGLVVKLGCGPVLDRLGGYASTLLVMALLALATASIAAVDSVPRLYAVYSLCLGAAAPVWPSLLLVIKAHGQPREYDGLVRLLALTSRTANIVGRLTIGAALALIGWRWLALEAAMLGGAAVAILAVGLPAAPTRAAPAAEKYVKKALKAAGGGTVAPAARLSGAGGALRALLRKPWYRRALALSGANVTLARFEYLVGFYVQETSADLSPSLAAMLAACYPLGLLCCVLGPGYFYARSTEPAARRRLLLGLQAVNVAACAASVGLCGLQAGRGVAAARAALLFCTTFGMGLPFYVVLSSAAMRLAPANIALCGATLDACGYLCALLAQGGMSRMLLFGGWRAVWAFMTAVSCVGFGSLWSFLAAAHAEEARMRGEAGGEAAADEERPPDVALQEQAARAEKSS